MHISGYDILGHFGTPFLTGPEKRGSKDILYCVDLGQNLSKRGPKMGQKRAQKVVKMGYFDPFFDPFLDPLFEGSWPKGANLLERHKGQWPGPLK